MSANCTLSECLEFFDDALTTLRAGFIAIEDQLPKPLAYVRAGHFEVRYVEKSIELAMFLKLARSISLLGGLRVLVERSMAQEVGILKRAIDETDEDIIFLGFGHQNGMEPAHEWFLDAFWAEEFEDPAAVLVHTHRKSVSRKKIQAYNASQMGPDPSTAQSVNRVIHGVFSGFVHGASIHILDLYDLGSKRFSIAGLENTPVRRSYIIDSTNYPFRVLMSAVMVSRRLGLNEIADGFYSKFKEAEKFIGIPTEEEAAALVAKMRGKNGDGH